MNPRNRERVLKHLPRYFPKASIICTIGDSVFATKGVSHGAVEIEKNLLRELVGQGMTIARINFSWVGAGKGYSYEDVRLLIKTIRQISEDRGMPIGILMDLKGPEIRIGEIDDALIDQDNNGLDLVKLAKQQSEGKSHIVLTQLTDQSGKLPTGQAIRPCDEDFPFDMPRIPVIFEGTFNEGIEEEAPIFIDDGQIKLVVIKEERKSGDIICEVEYGEVLKPGKGINRPGIFFTGIDIPIGKDIQDIEQEFDIDYIAQSFVREASDCENLRRIVDSVYGRKSKNIKLIAKIENYFAWGNIDDILNSPCVDAVMVARGDLGVEVPFADVPRMQKDIIDKANILAKPVIVATQMLESIRERPVPTRAEVQDVATAVRQGADVVMLSGETASGKYPREAVDAMNTIVTVAAENLDRVEYLAKFRGEFAEAGDDLIFVLGYPLCKIAEDAHSPVIVSYGTTGATASRIAKYRPTMPILVISKKGHEEAARTLLLYYNIYPVVVDKPQLPRESKEFIDQAKAIIREMGFAPQGGLVAGTLLLEHSDDMRRGSGVINMFRL